ncbi:NADPH:quinone dehydrogenase [Methylobacterium sp. Leaf94]|uniref:acrylyl-CoA reductase (NADPH) n=1 Tax=Methylobacterium sp. Leaf94 TaxID=1736250 RepID=UPI0006FF56AC|nr:MDR family oxidoreductase [Methylobacterium sp. Leaf94]KQU35335.1 NADPH:quinone dehydrogenase [Methylobacterium sp. Leaf94]
MGRFKAWVIEKTETGQSLAFQDFDDADLMPGDVTVRVTHSTVNYKDGLAMTGKSPVVRRFPMIPGIDFAGIVETSDHPDYQPGDAVVLTGWGVGETHLGAYALRARVKGDWLVPLPQGLSPAQAMAIGTAGYTAMLCLMALDHHGATPSQGPVLVTGASGGVGSVAVALLARAGWHVIASTGRDAESHYLRGLGASEILDRAELSQPGKPLAKERWAAAVDAVGSVTLANVLAGTKVDGAVAACGLAQGMDLPTSVAPFILRGVSLLGINSVTTPQPKRRAAWDRLARELDHDKLAAMTQTVPLAGVDTVARAILEGRVRGRTVVEVARA